MPSVLQSLAVLATSLAGTTSTSYHFRDKNLFGYGFQVGPLNSSGNYISSLTYDLSNVPAVPIDYTEGSFLDPIRVVFWVGVSDVTSDKNYSLAQPYLEWTPEQEQAGCNGTIDQWCVTASTFQPVGFDHQVGQPYVVVPASANLSFSITTTAEKTATQKVWMDGQLVSEQTDNMEGLAVAAFGTSECFTGYYGNCGSIKGYSWTNMILTLAEADLNMDVINDRTTGNLTTLDGGKTWTGSFTLPEEEWLEFIPASA